MRYAHTNAWLLYTKYKLIHMIYKCVPDSHGHSTVSGLLEYSLSQIDQNERIGDMLL